MSQQSSILDPQSSIFNLPRARPPLNPGEVRAYTQVCCHHSGGDATSTRTRHLTHGVLVLPGLALTVGAIITEAHGASVVGLTVAGINAWQLLKVRNM